MVDTKKSFAFAGGLRRPFAIMVGSACVLQTVAGCIPLSDKPNLVLDIPPAYRAKVGAADAALPSLEWWRGFRSPELTALVETALVDNLDIAAAVARIRQADANAKISGAALLPTIDADASVTRSQSSGTTGPVPTDPTQRTRYSTGLTASYEIDFWGKNRATLRAAEATALASRYDREVVALSAIASVANTYFTILASQDRLRFARENVRSASRILDVIKQRLNVGTGTALDVAQQESILATQRATIPALEQTLRQNIATLAVLVGRAPEEFNLRGGSMSRVTIPRVTPGLPSDLLLQRPDIREAELQLRAADANIDAARAAFFPSIQLTGQGGWESAALQTLFQPNSIFYSVAAGATQPIFRGFALQGQLELQEARYVELVNLYRKAVISGFADVESALITTREQTTRERLQREAVASAQRAYQLSEQRLREGTVDIVTVLNTQQTLFQAQDVLAQVQLARLQAVVSLYQALGGGWPLDITRTPAR